MSTAGVPTVVRQISCSTPSGIHPSGGGVNPVRTVQESSDHLTLSNPSLYFEFSVATTGTCLVTMRIIIKPTVVIPDNNPDDWVD